MHHMEQSMILFVTWGSHAKQLLGRTIDAIKLGQNHTKS